MKTCSDCNQAKPFDEFARQREPENRGEERTADGVNTCVKVCTTERQQRTGEVGRKHKDDSEVGQWVEEQAGE